jgi:hypothetical protein
MYENQENQEPQAKPTYEELEAKLTQLELDNASANRTAVYYKDKYFEEASKISDVKDYLDEMWHDNTDEDVSEEYETIANKLGIDLTITREFTITATFNVTISGKRGEVDWDSIDDSNFDVSLSERYSNSWNVEDYTGTIDSVEQD